MIPAGRGTTSLVSEVVPLAVAHESFSELPDEDLYPAEAAAVRNAVSARREEFRTVRGCARAALAVLGMERPPLVPGRRGYPPWPEGVLGSMTHCPGYRAACVALAGPVRALGVDAEPNAPLPAGVLTAVALPAERRQITRLSSGSPEIAWDRVLFSVKESVYKSWYPAARRSLGFREVEIRFEEPNGFAARLPTGGPLGGVVRGRWLCRHGLVLTGVCLRGPEIEQIGPAL